MFLFFGSIQARKSLQAFVVALGQNSYVLISVFFNHRDE
jgi:hypothetical protein